MRELAVGSDDDPSHIRFDRQAVGFADGYTLEFNLLVDEYLASVEYHYVYRVTGGEVLCRLDKHAGHANLGGAAGGLCHVHRPDGRGGEVAEAAPEYDFDDALDFLRGLSPD